MKSYVQNVDPRRRLLSYKPPIFQNWNRVQIVRAQKKRQMAASFLLQPLREVRESYGCIDNLWERWVSRCDPAISDSAHEVLQLAELRIGFLL